MANGYVVFEDAAKELNMSEDALKGLMDEGKIRHFMDGGKIKFRRKDLDDLKSSLGIEAPVAEEDEITLAPPDELPDIPSVEEAEVPPPPPAAAAEEDEFAMEPLDESIPEAPPAETLAASTDTGTEEEIASLSDFEIGEELEEEGEELSEEEAQLISVETPGFRTYEEPEAASVGMTVLLVASAVLVAFGVVALLSLVMGTNPFPSLTSIFVK